MSLKNKIPPPIVALLFLALIYFTRELASLEFPYQSSVAAVVLAAAIAVMICAVIEFRRLETTVNPLKPESSTALVTGGVFRFSRNPMYLGLLGILTAAAIFFGALAAIAVLPLFILYMNVFQISPEEKAMEKLFREEYGEYRAQVRRWV